MKKLYSLVLPLLLGLFVWCAASFADHLVTTRGAGVAQASITNTTAAIPAVSTTVTLVAASSRIRISNRHTTTELYVDLANGTATTADYNIGPGQVFEYDGPPISSFKVIGSAAAGNYAVAAW